MKTKLFLMSCFSMAIMLFAGCGDSDDGSGFVEETGGTNANVPAMSASEAKRSLQTTADDLLAKVKVNELENFKDIFDAAERWGVQEGDPIAAWFEAAKGACLISSNKYNEYYLWKAANFVGEFTLNDFGEWTQTKRGGDKLVFKFDDANHKPCVLTVTASAAGTEIHHNSFDGKEWDWKYENGYYQEFETVTKENRFILPKQTKVTLTQNGVKKVDVTVNASVSTGKEVDFAKDAINVTSTMVINDYTIEIQKASYKAGKSANAKATISKNRETLITISGSALGTVTTTGEDSSVGKTSISVNILNRAKIVANIDDVELLNHNLDKASNCDTDRNQLDRYLSNANRLFDGNLYLENSSNSSATLYYKSVVADGYWDYETMMKFADGSEYSIDSYFNEKSFRRVVYTVEAIIEDFREMFGISDSDNGLN